MANRVLIIGLDGGTMDVVEPLARQGRLPNMAKMISSGFSGRLTSVYPPITSPAWSSFLTGKNPGKHGVFDFKRKSQEGLREMPVNSADIKAETIWRLASRYGKSCCMLNVPMTFPPEPLNGYMVSGLPCPSNRISTFPTGLAEELNSLSYREETKGTYYQLDKLSFSRDVLETTRVQAKAALHLLRKRQWDVFMVVFMGADWLSHFYWRYLDPSHPHYNKSEADKYNSIPEFYELADNILGDLMAAAGPDVVTVVGSDHGFGSLHRHVYINSWLRDIGLLVLREQKQSRKLVPAVMNGVGVTPEKLINFFMKYTPSSLKKRVPQSLFDDFNAFLSKSSITPFYNLEDVDWSKTKAYCAGHVGQIWINRKGADQNGVVADEDYESTRDFVISSLRKLTDPETGRKVVTQVFRREDIYQGKYASDGPDVLFIMEDLRYVAWEGISLDRRYFADPDNLASGFHRMDGMLLLSGPPIRRSSFQANIVDVLPTVMHILGVPMPSDCDGRVLRDLFSPGSEQAKQEILVAPPKESDWEEFKWEAEDEKMVGERLKGLGYM